MNREERGSAPPDFTVGIAVVVVGIESLPGAAIVRDVLRVHFMNGRHIAARGLACEGPVHLVHDLPTLKIERLGNSPGLIEAGADAHIRRDAAVAGGNTTHA